MLWLAPFALAAHDTAKNRKWMAAYHTYMGDFAAARSDIAAVRAVLPDEELELAVELHLGEPLDSGRVAKYGMLASDASLPPSSSDEEHRREAFEAAARRVRRADASDAGERTCLPSIEPAFRAALVGDGQPLAALLRDCPKSTARLPLTRVLAILPRITQHLEELRSQLRIVRDESRRYLAFDLLEFATRRDLMRVSGDPVRAAQWQAIIDRHAHVLGDRDRVIALMWLGIL